MQAHVKVFPSRMEPVGAVLFHSAVWRMIEMGVMKFPLGGTLQSLLISPENRGNLIHFIKKLYQDYFIIQDSSFITRLYLEPQLTVYT